MAIKFGARDAEYGRAQRGRLRGSLAWHHAAHKGRVMGLEIEAAALQIAGTLGGKVKAAAE